MKKILFLSLSLVLITASVSAQGPRDRFNRHRVVQGHRSGELTRGETHHLVRQQKHIKHAERLARRDGHVSRHERHKIHRMKKHHSREVYRFKHNRRHR
ncbi:hypothetical protein JMG10_15110 [Nostoc ellipsosporum NOK]|jgi:hypothetical protein|nr:hypothetical protein [Nostoc ellipsosporum NOK]